MADLNSRVGSLMSAHAGALREFIAKDSKMLRLEIRNHSLMELVKQRDIELAELDQKYRELYERTDGRHTQFG